MRVDTEGVVRPRLPLRALHLDPLGVPSRPNEYEEVSQNPNQPPPPGLTSPRSFRDDTPVCHTQTKRWEAEVESLPGLVILTISKDLPFAQARWKEREGVTHRTLSTYRDERFAADYGVLLKELQLLQRAVFIIDPAGDLVHVEYIQEQTQEPNYQAALEAAQAVK